jgi:small subunit ribosomal protein S6
MSRPTTAPNGAREYETVYILRPDIDADSAERVGSRVADVIGRESGRMTKVELWGRRRLAYEIKKNKRGIYVYLRYLGNGRTVSEVERNLRLTDGVLRYQTVLARNDVVVADVAIAEEDVRFERLELPPIEEERDESFERQLGLVEPERRERAPEAVVDDVDVVDPPEEPTDDEEA